ncbi:MAG: iron-sulfur cluster insertion protein ErpA [Candidatus Aquirickettsiella sp.]
MQPIVITDNAASKIWELITEEENFQLKLRVFITGGGCSGFQYGFSFDETINEDDSVITKSILKKDAGHQDPINVHLLVDPMSLVYLRGAEIDYKSDLTGEQFIIRNPNAKTTCGCGSSFAA